MSVLGPSMWLLSQMQHIAAPAISIWDSQLRYELGFNDVSRARHQLYDLNKLSVGYGPLAEAPQHTAVNLSPGQAIQSYHQGPRIGATREQIDAQAERLKANLSIHGIRFLRPGVTFGPGPQNEFGQDRAHRLAQQMSAIEWQRLVGYAAAAAPLGIVVRDYWRGYGLPGEQRAVTNAELAWNFQRAQLSRPEDRERILRPSSAWGPHDIVMLRWLGAIDADEAERLFGAAGVSWDKDQEFLRLLTTRRPSPETLIGWANRSLWDEGIARRFALDDGYDNSPIAQFFARAQGVGLDQPPLPGQPAGETNWGKLAYRASRTLVGWGHAKEMQQRLRPLVQGQLESVIPGVPAWTEFDTRDMLRAEGMPDSIANCLVGLVHEPLNIRLINHILGPYSTHPEVRAAADAAFGAGVNWIERAMLDHGFSPAYARVAAVGVQAQADDRDQAEKTASVKRQRQENRNSWLAGFEVGKYNEDQARAGIVDEFFDADMARKEVSIVKDKIDQSIMAVKIKAVESAYMAGSKSAADCRVALDAVGVVEARRDQYLDEWAWQRTGHLKTLTTGEILGALKSGLISPPVALSRLTNLGWSQPDALIEVAQVEQALTIAQARTAQATAAKVAAEAHHQQMIRDAELKRQTAAQVKAAHEKARAEKAEHAALVKAQAEQRKVDRDVALASHEKLLAQSDYYRTVHTANVALAAADKKGDTEKTLSEIERQVGAYQRYLIDQIKLIAQGPEVANVVAPIDTAEASSAAGPVAVSPPAGISGGPAAPT